MRKIDNFTNLYSMQKTLRFKLLPVGATEENFRLNNLLSEDERRAESYTHVKKYLDRFYKAYIDEILPQIRLNGLREYAALYHKTNKTDADKKAMEKAEDDLRKQIAGALTADKVRYGNLFKKEVILALPDFLTDEQEKERAKEFADFTSYFDGFFENRKNMFTSEAKATGIAQRCIRDNLPRFLDNAKNFMKIKAALPDVVQSINIEFEDWFSVMPEDIFCVDGFTYALCQDDIDKYNQVIGGYSNADKTKIQGLNEKINLYNQPIKDKSKKLPLLKPLYKQILSERNTVSFIPEKFENDSAVLASIHNYFTEYAICERAEKLRELFCHLDGYVADGIYVKNDLALTEVSNGVFGVWDAVRRTWEKEYDDSKGYKDDEKYLDARAKAYKSHESFSIAEIDRLGNKSHEDPEEKTVAAWASKEITVLADALLENYKKSEDFISAEYKEDKKLCANGDRIGEIKTLLDSVKALEGFVKRFVGTGKEENKDDVFYGELLPEYEAVTEIDRLYDRVRNYVTQKPFSNEKIKLNFGIHTDLLKGWVDSKTEKSDNGTQYRGYLFRKKNEIEEYDYFLGISQDTKLFRSFNEVETDDRCDYERLEYYQPKEQTIYGGAYKGERTYDEDKNALLNAIKTFLQQENEEGFSDLKEYVSGAAPTPRGCVERVSKIPGQIEKLLKNSTFAEANTRVIEALKTTMSGFTRLPGAKMVLEKNYILFSEIMDDITELTKNKVFRYFSVSQEEWESAQDSLYLFQISNKDLSYAKTFSAGMRKSRGRENLHTMFFKALMSGQQAVFDIGRGMVFYREGKPLYSDEIMEKGHHYNELKDKFSYPIIKDKRYTKPQFMFHLSINVNYKAPDGKRVDVTEKVNYALRDCEDNYVIGIDRGERNLLYICVINGNGDIVKQFSLNDIVNEYNYTTYYHKLLSAKEKERLDARKNWSAVANIKDLKEGYISQVIHKICELVEKYDAVIAMEDLNFGFKSSRSKVEKSVYQKFEKMLIDKLNFYVNKAKDPSLPGGLYNGYQLTEKFESFQKMGKQNGFIFYIPAWLTSKIDPVTGFADMLYPRYDSVAASQKFLGKFKRIAYNAERDYFEFEFDYSDFGMGNIDYRKCWTVCTFGERIETFRNKEKNGEWDNKVVDLTAECKQLFAQYSVCLSGDMKQEILNCSEADFYRKLMRLLKLTLQMRNSRTGTDEDYLISPVPDSNGRFYCSNDYSGEDAPLPVDADANGAYHIAKKALWAIRQIRQCPVEDIRKAKISISKAEWLAFVQSHE